MTAHPLQNKRIIVTGGNSGIGLDALRVFCAQGAHVIMASRDDTRAQAAVAAVLQAQPDATVEYVNLDLNDLANVRHFASLMTARFDSLDVLVNNAGVMYGPYTQTKDGLEHQIGINHFGHFALTGLLLPLLKKAPGSRIVTVSSIAHRRGKMNFKNLHCTNGQGYTPQGAYGQSKLANLLFGFELDRKLKEHGVDTKSILVHPGVAKTNLFDQLATGPFQRRLFQALEWFIQSSQKGALPTIAAVVNDDLQGGEYLGPDGFMEIKGDPTTAKASKRARSVLDAKELWRISEETTGVLYSFD